MSLTKLQKFCLLSACSAIALTGAGLAINYSNINVKANNETPSLKAFIDTESMDWISFSNVRSEEYRDGFKITHECIPEAGVEIFKFHTNKTNFYFQRITKFEITMPYTPGVDAIPTITLKKADKTVAYDFEGRDLNYSVDTFVGEGTFYPRSKILSMKDVAIFQIQHSPNQKIRKIAIEFTCQNL